MIISDYLVPAVSSFDISIVQYLAPFTLFTISHALIKLLVMNIIASGDYLQKLSVYCVDVFDVFKKCHIIKETCKSLMESVICILTLASLRKSITVKAQITYNYCLYLFQHCMKLYKSKNLTWIPISIDFLINCILAYFELAVLISRFSIVQVVSNNTALATLSFSATHS